MCDFEFYSFDEWYICGDILFEWDFGAELFDEGEDDINFFIGRGE